MSFIKLLSNWKDTNWKVSVIYTVDRDVDFFRTFEKILKNIYDSSDYRRRVNLQNKKIYEFDVFSLAVQYNLDQSNDKFVRVELLFNKINVTYKNSNRRLEELQQIFHKLEESLHFEDKVYDLHITFSQNFHNPFYGVAIRHLGEEHVNSFECSFPMKIFNIRHSQEIGHLDSDVHVFGINITTDDFGAVKSCAKKCSVISSEIYRAYFKEENLGALVTLCKFDDAEKVKDILTEKFDMFFEQHTFDIMKIIFESSNVRTAKFEVKIERSSCQ